MDQKSAVALAESCRSEMLTLLHELIATPSPYGSSAKEAQTCVGDYLEHNGFDVQLTEDPPDASRHHPEFSAPPPPSTETPVNLIARARNARPSGLTLFAHVDTEAVIGGWSSPPYEAVFREGRVHGLGAADDKGGLAAVAVAAAALLRSLRKAPLVASVHGKGGGARGTLPVFGRLEEAGDSLYVHPPENGGGLDVLKNASRGVLDVTLEVAGWHGRPREIGTPESAPFEEGGNALEACLAVVDALRGGELSDCEINLGRIVAGEKVGLTPAHCHAELRVLFAETKTVDGVLESVRRAAENYAGSRSRSEETFRFEVTAPGLSANSASTAWSDRFSVELRAAVAEVTGRKPLEYIGHLASDIRFPIRLRGASSIGIGSLAGNFFGADEWVDLDDLVRLVAVILLFVSRWQSSE